MTPTIFEKISNDIKSIKKITKEKVKEEVKNEILYERIEERYRGWSIWRKLEVIIKILCA